VWPFEFDLSRAIVMSRAVGIVLGFVCAASSSAPICADDPPPVPREFRGVWVATVQNVDWPSKRGLSTQRQKRELVRIMDTAVERNLNAVIFQVRPSADAFYNSKLEPWSEFLTGRMGQPPEPVYDPLRFAVEQAHRRGLQLHAWFNPYRVRVPNPRGPASPDHASVAHPELVRDYGGYKWFDPGEPAAVDHFIAVLSDVVKRYDIDGVHIDDYFYPYPVREKATQDEITGKEVPGAVVPFPDDESYAKAVAAGETLARDDWRRQNVNHLIRRMYEAVKQEKPWVLVGISPFGIWRPGHPEGIVGFDQYASLYADARKWQQEGWLDYLTPQLYWRIDSTGQSYPKLLAWWHEQNVKGRHLWPGNFTSKVRRNADVEETRNHWSAQELIRQIEATRAQPGATGNVHFSMKAFFDNRDGLNDKLDAGVYAEQALVPDSPWLGDAVPSEPEVSASRQGDRVVVEMKLPDEKPWLWVVRTKAGDQWKTAIVPGREDKYSIEIGPNDAPTEAVVSAVTRLGREGPFGRASIEH
jgi:uncharacterized lipoprotein YddW (UPF0748 family)